MRTYLVRNLDLVPFFHITDFDSIALPVLAICGQRLVIDLRRLRETPQGSSEISKVVDRQIGALSRHQHYQLSVIREDNFNPDGENVWPGSEDDGNEP